MSEDNYRAPKKHRLVAIEGIDCAGKGMQSRILAKKLSGALFNFPAYETNTGRLIKTALETGSISPHSEAWACLLSANRYEVKKLLESCLRHADVVCNRYYPSNIIYSTASGLNTDWLKALDECMPEPDIVIVIDIPVEESISRKHRRDVIESDKNYLEKVRQTYLTLGPLFGWKIVDGLGTPDAVHEKICQALGAVIQTPESQPV